MQIDVKTMPKLGFGLMRLPEKDGAIDMDRVCHMVDQYMDAGLNYFDTAYIYHGGKSEGVVKEALVKRYPREAFRVATKLPAWEVKCAEDRDRIFEEQLSRTGLDCFDFYLLHSLEDGDNYNTYVKYDCFRWAMQKKAEGKIKHFGFSFHGTPELLEEVLAAHPEVEFVQIQLNYADWDNPMIQSGKLYEILHRYQKPIIVMEPVKGGSLAAMDERFESRLKATRPEASIASWALRFVASLEGVMTILSGMSNEEQMADNVKTITDLEPVTQEEEKLLRDIAEQMRAMPLIPCTSCRYCCDGCPAGISIPDVFRCLGAARAYPEDGRAKGYYEGMIQEKGKASACVQCGQCESVCPQHLPIIELMQEAAKLFGE